MPTSLARTAYNNLNPNAVQKSIEASQIRDKFNSHIILESESEDEIIQQSNNSNNNSTIENQEETIMQNINTIPENGLKEIDNWSTSSEKKSVSLWETELSKPPTLKKIPKYNPNLKKAVNGKQQYLFQVQVKSVVNAAKNGIANLMMIAFVP